MVKYIQLTPEERYQISAFIQAGKRRSEIAMELGRHVSTIGRELRRNHGRRGYRPKQAHELAEQRRQQAGKHKKMTIEMKTVITARLQLQWSPEQIAGWLKWECHTPLSHETIYQYVYKDRQQGGTLFRQLRWCRRKRRKRFPGPDKRGQIPNRRWIDERPAVVTAKRRCGDWEGDTLIGKNHQAGLLTMVERKSKYMLACKIVDRKAETINQNILAIGHKLQGALKTLTVDNGKEFAGHQILTSQLGLDVFFAHPYHAWERGLNEQTNGLLRQYFPKGVDFRCVTIEQVLRAQDLLNHRPRKTLGYRTPHDIFIVNKRIRDIFAFNKKVALIT